VIVWGLYHGSGRDFSGRKSAATTTESIGAGLPVLMGVMYGGVPNVIRLNSKHAGKSWVLFLCFEMVRNDVKLPERRANNMTQEQFEALGIEKSLAKKAAEESKKELENYVAKETFDATEQKRKQLETSVQERETQLEELKASAGDNEALKQQIADLQAQNKQKDLDNQKEMDDLKMTYAIRMAVSASAQDSDLVAGLVDRNKLILGDDGKVTGLDEQVKALKESKPFLFKAEDNGGKKGFFRLNPKDNGGSDGEGRMSMKEAIAAKLNMGSEGKE
jgi:hypothetical protein